MKRKIDFVKLSVLNNASFVAGPSKTQAASSVVSNVTMSFPSQHDQNAQNTRIPFIGQKS